MREVLKKYNRTVKNDAYVCHIEFHIFKDLFWLCFKNLKIYIRKSCGEVLMRKVLTFPD